MKSLLIVAITDYNKSLHSVPILSIYYINIIIVTHCEGGGEYI